MDDWRDVGSVLLIGLWVYALCHGALYEMRKCESAHLAKMGPDERWRLETGIVYAWYRATHERYLLGRASRVELIEVYSFFAELVTCDRPLDDAPFEPDDVTRDARLRRALTRQTEEV